MRDHLITAASFYVSVIGHYFDVNHAYMHDARELLTQACDSGDDLDAINSACDDLRGMHDHVIKLYGIPTSQLCGI